MPEDDNEDYLLIRNGFEKSEMGAAIEKLYDAIEGLADSIEPTGDIAWAGGNFSIAADKLVNVNSSLANGWYEVSDLLNKVSKMVQEMISGIVVEFNRYIEGIISGEAEALNAVKESNDITNSLLDELNSL